ncbi:FecCD family ABC transporter permease [Algicella marina]|uniref:FecCD family ABC transporter permease n=1 Tax=Algicella marina TaxID=2683284 RepID=UPI00137B3A3B|nr:iron ABC transporter permease [Algicella marina]
MRSIPKTPPRWVNDVALAERITDGPRIGAKPLLLCGLLAAALAAAVAELVLGPVAVPLAELQAWLAGRADAGTAAILGQIRAPRMVLALLVGTGLALAGTTLQGILRNPLADPGLIGVTAGASLGAVTVIVLGGAFFAGVPTFLRPYLLPCGAFLGAATVTGFVFLVSRRGGQTSVATLILAGVAINAVCFAGVGALTYISDDQQLRNLTFWQMGSLGGASWPVVLVTAPVITVSAYLLHRLATPLDLFQLGERAAFHSGVDTERVKLKAGLLTALAVGSATAAAGPIGFIGLVAPHMARLVLGAQHHWVLPGAALLGTALLLAADLVVRLAVPPAEPPIGLATALIGGPFFLWLLLTRLRGLTHV